MGGVRGGGGGEGRDEGVHEKGLTHMRPTLWIQFGTPANLNLSYVNSLTIKLRNTYPITEAHACFSFEFALIDTCVEAFSDFLISLLIYFSIPLRVWKSLQSEAISSSKANVRGSNEDSFNLFVV